MSTNANIHIIQNRKDKGIYLYSHYDGFDVPKILQKALIRGKSRWDCTPFLIRIIFSEMIKDDIMGTIGYGISNKRCGKEDVYIEISVDNQKILYNKIYSFDEYINLNLDM